MEYLEGLSIKENTSSILTSKRLINNFNATKEENIQNTLVTDVKVLGSSRHSPAPCLTYICYMLRNADFKLADGAIYRHKFTDVASYQIDYIFGLNVALDFLGLA